MAGTLRVSAKQMREAAARAGGFDHLTVSDVEGVANQVHVCECGHTADQHDYWYGAHHKCASLGCGCKEWRDAGVTHGSAAQKRSKYRNVRTVVDGETFDSKKEAQHWHELKLREKAGEIQELQRQVAYPLYVQNKVSGISECIGEYRADFQYRERSGALRVEDVKGMRSLPLYRWKVKHLKAQDGIEVTEIR